MAKWFDFSEPSYQFKTLDGLRRDWLNVPDASARSAIAETHQYYDFLITMIIGRLQSWSHPPDQREDWFTPTPLTLSARAGAVSSTIVAAASIVECAMRAHGQQRNLKKLLKKPPQHRTFGTVIYAWAENGVYSDEIAPVLEDLKLLNDRRNDLHLFSRGDRTWQDVYDEEGVWLRRTNRLILFFQELEPAAL
jgi:hypothetical protein